MAKTKSSKIGQEQKILISFFLISDRYIHFWKGDWALAVFPLNFEIFLTLFNPWDPRSSVIRKLVGQPVCKVCDARYHVPIYLWWIKTVLKLSQLPNIMTWIVVRGDLNLPFGCQNSLTNFSFGGFWG